MDCAPIVAVITVVRERMDVVPTIGIVVVGVEVDGDTGEWHSVDGVVGPEEAGGVVGADLTETIVVVVIIAVITKRPSLKLIPLGPPRLVWLPLGP